MPTELVVDVKHMVRLREILDELGYKPDDRAKFMHFEKEVSQGHVRVELLTGPIGPELIEKVRLNKLPRVRPKGEVELHAYLTAEAVALEVDPLSVLLWRRRLRADSQRVRVSPHEAACHACRDRLDDEDKQLGRHHALDVYRVLAMLSEPEVQLVRRLRRDHRDNAAVLRALAT